MSLAMGWWAKSTILRWKWTLPGQMWGSGSWSWSWEWQQTNWDMLKVDRTWISWTVSVPSQDLKTQNCTICIHQLGHTWCILHGSSVPGEEGSGSGGGDRIESYNDDWTGHGSHSPPYSKPARNPAENPAKPPRVKERNGPKWNRNNGHGRVKSASVQQDFSLFPLLFLAILATAAPMWR